MNLTTEQQRAVSSIHGNLIVNAGAGTGKTEVLTRRYLEIIRESVMNGNLPIESVAAITFTVKAANEMKERIRKMVSEEELDEKLLQDLENSTVTTIHGFFSKILKDYSYYVKIDPLFEIMEEGDSQELLTTITEEVLVELQEESEIKKSPLLLQLMEELSIYYFSDLLTEIQDFYKEFRIYSDSLEEIKKRTIENLRSYHYEFNPIDFRYSLEELKGTLKKNTKIYKFLVLEENAKILEGLSPVEEDFLLELNELLKGSSVKERELIDEISLIIDHVFLSKEKEKIPLYEILFDKILQEIQERYKSEKEKVGMLDFSDLEHLVYEITEIPFIRNELREKYRYFMIDEYQDINDIQKEIFYRLTSKKEKLDCQNLFVVGDPKQSIYGFRGANIFVFDETREDILSTGGEEIVFKDNFRSDKNVIDPVNKIYNSRMAGRFHPLDAHRDKKDISFFSVASGKEFKRMDEGNIMASLIQENAAKGLKSYGDYSFLLSARSLQKEILPGLKEKEIPYYIMRAPGFYETDEIFDMINYLLFLYNEDDLLSLTGILNSLFYNRSLAEIEELIDYLKGEEKTVKEEILASYEDLISRRENYLELLRKKGIYSLLTEMIKEYEIFEKLNRDFSDYQRQGNLYKLLRLGREADDRNLDLEEFLRELLNKKGEDEQMQIEDETSPVVKIMTIHESKGLGFSEVFVPALNRKLLDNRSKIKLHKVYGIAMNLKNANIRYQKIGEEEKEKTLVESDNLYYVAMTRAKENLYLGLSGNNGGYKKYISETVEDMVSQNEIKTIDEVSETEFERTKAEKDEIKDHPMIFNPLLREKSYPSLNITMVMDYLEKGIGYLFERTREEEEGYELEMPAFLKGQIIHAFAEKYENKKNADSLLASILEEFHVESKHRYLFQAYADNLADFLESDLKYDRIHREYPFSIRMDDYTFNGVIDRIEMTEDCVRIIDFKLSGQKKESLVKRYWLQMVFYGYVCEKLFHKKISLEIYNLEKNEKIRIPYDEKRKEEMKNKIGHFLKEIESHIEVK